VEEDANNKNIQSNYCTTSALIIEKERRHHCRPVKVNKWFLYVNAAVLTGSIPGSTSRGKIYVSRLLQVILDATQNLGSRSRFHSVEIGQRLEW